MDTAYNTLFRPWKHIFSYRFMIKQQFPIVALNVWFNGIEIGSTSKKAAEFTDKFYLGRNVENDESVKPQYIPFATGEYKVMQHHSYRPRLKEIIFGPILFTKIGYRRIRPKWVIDQDGILNGCLFYKLLKHILLFPNCVISVPSTMYDNTLFMLYLKYMMTKFNMEKKTEIFCVMFKNMEEEIAKYYQKKKCIVLLSEHRSFSISVIRDHQRIVDNKHLMKKFMAFDKNKYKNRKTTKAKYFPDSSGFYHYRDDYDLNFFIANVSDFDFIESVKDKTTTLRTRSDSDQKKDAVPANQHEMQFWYSRKKEIEASNTAPTAISDQDKKKNAKKNDDFYYKLKKTKEEEKESHDIMKELVNDVFVGPNDRKDILENNDEKTIDFYEGIRAPFARKLCYSPNDLIVALKEVLNECNKCKVFENDDDDKKEEESVSVIMVGPLANYYGDFVGKYIDSCNDSKLEFIKEYVENKECSDIKGRSSALNHILQSIVTPDELSDFKSISEIKKEIFTQ